MRAVLGWALGGLALLALALWAMNTPRFAPPLAGGPGLLAHRGVHQTFSREGLGRDDCTATRIGPPEHAFLENTIPSIRRAFDLGASIVEIDIHPTTDGEFVVFHDWTLDCRTEGTGVVREQPSAYLRTLDVGFGYTADGGRSFPFRGLGVGAMPTLDEVLEAFAGRRFLLNVKSDDPAEGEALVAYLSRHDGARLGRLGVYGSGERPLDMLRSRSGMRVFSMGQARACLYRYLALGWSGHVPGPCRDTAVLVPVDWAWVLWGWPTRFERRMRDAGSEVYLVGPGGRGGIDDPETLAAVPDGFSGFIWTDKIEIVGPALREPR